MTKALIAVLILNNDCSRKCPYALQQLPSAGVQEISFFLSHLNWWIFTKNPIGDGVTVPYNNFYDVAAFTIHLLQQVDFNQNEFVN